MSSATHLRSYVRVPKAWIVWLIFFLVVVIAASAVMTWWERSSSVSQATPVRIHPMPDPIPGPMAAAPARIVTA